MLLRRSNFCVKCSMSAVPEAMERLVLLAMRKSKAKIGLTIHTGESTPIRVHVKLVVESLFSPAFQKSCLCAA